jgi:hypothetical protein
MTAAVSCAATRMDPIAVYSQARSAAPDFPFPSRSSATPPARCRRRRQPRRHRGVLRAVHGPDQGAALAGISRVLRPGGTLCFLEHVRAGSPGLVRMQRGLEATAWPHLFGGCHLSRDTAATIERRYR